MTPIYIIKITDRIRWKERCEWIETHCDGWQDHTSWDWWDIGFSDIEYSVKSEKHVIMYYLAWT